VLIFTRLTCPHAKLTFRSRVADRIFCLLSSSDAVPGEIKKWERRATLPDSHGNVAAVRFAPAHLGLKLATASSDGFVRFYEAIDITNLSQWQITDQFDASEGQQQQGVNCIDWNPNPFDQAMVAVGTNDSEAKIYQYNDKLRKWEPVATLSGHIGAIHDIAWAPNMGRSYHMLATASKDKSVRIWKLDLIKGKLEAKQVALFSDHNAEVWRVEWNITGTILASSGDDNSVRLWKQNLMGEWKPLSTVAAAEEGDN
jgi:nucleoporin SEH1